MQCAKMLMGVYENNGTTFVFGNGGSAANASHICGDLIKGVSYGLEKRFKIICLNDNIPALMAIANDISYDDMFLEQIKNFIGENDLVIGISGSGKSANVLRAMEYANSVAAKTVAFCGYDGGDIKNIAHLAIHADINNMEVVEDIHTIIMHCLKTILKKQISVINDHRD